MFPLSFPRISGIFTYISLCKAPNCQKSPALPTELRQHIVRRRSRRLTVYHLLISVCGCQAPLSIKYDRLPFPFQQFPERRSCLSSFLGTVRSSRIPIPIYRRGFYPSSRKAGSDASRSHVLRRVFSWRLIVSMFVMSASPRLWKSGSRRLIQSACL